MADPLVIDPRLLDTHRPQARLERTLRQTTITHDQPPSVLAHAALVLLHIRADFRFDGRLQHLLCSLAQQFVQRRTAARFNLLFQTDYILLFHRCPEGCAAIVCWQQCFLSPSGCLFSTPHRPQLLEISLFRFMKTPITEAPKHRNTNRRPLSPGPWSRCQWSCSLWRGPVARAPVVSLSFLVA